VGAEFAGARDVRDAVRAARSTAGGILVRWRSCALALIGSGFVLTAPAIAAPERADPDAIRGLWVDHRDADKRKVAVWIEDCDSELCGRIYWLKKPLTKDGQHKHDRHNPDAALRHRPLCGLTILTGFRPAEEQTWDSGEIYNPNDGSTFSSSMHLEPDGSLRIRGYIGITLLGKTVEWVRPQDSLERCDWPATPWR
jgi:uncharacterized protein (DUF2147 family)